MMLNISHSKYFQKYASIYQEDIQEDITIIVGRYSCVAGINGISADKLQVAGRWRYKTMALLLSIWSMLIQCCAVIGRAL